MSIITDQGIHTAELCENSKKYLSCLLIGKTGIQPDLLSWELLLTEKFNLYDFISTYQHTQGLSKQTILDNIVTLEIQPYDPEQRKQQAELRSKFIAGISLSIIVVLIINVAGTFALGLLGNFTLLAVVLCTILTISLLYYSILPTFFIEKPINPKWVMKYYLEKEKWQQKLTVNATSETAVIKEEIKEQLICSTTIQPMELNRTVTSLNGANKHTVHNKITGFIKRSVGFFNQLSLVEKSDVDTHTIYLNSLSSSNTSTNKSC